ncbi:acyl-CoA dehydrogenase family protein [Mycobacterium sp. NPDC003449]
MNVATILGEGLLGPDGVDENAELRALVDTLGRSAFDARAGSTRRPEVLDDALWRRLEDAGLTRLCSRTEPGVGPIEVAVVLHGLARHAGAVPIAESDLISGWLADAAGVAVAGSATAVAFASVEVSNGEVHGRALGAPWASQAPVVVVMAEAADGAYVASLGSRDLRVAEGTNIAGEPRDVVEFDLPLAVFARVDGPVGEEAHLRGTWARCIQVVGALEAAAERAIEYVQTRVQFGRSLSRFQSVQHSIAALAGEVERSRAVVALAVAAAATSGFRSEQTRFAVLAAKATLGQTVDAVTSAAHQLHGALGVTMEEHLWLHTMRAQSWVGEFGSPTTCARALGSVVLECGSPWDLVVASGPRA